MKKIFFLFFFTVASFSTYAQTYKAVSNKNKTYLETIKGLSYTYKEGLITLKNNGYYNLGTVSITVSSKVDQTLFGIALFDDGLERGKTVKGAVYFTTGLGNDTREISVKNIDQKNLVLSFDKATRAIR